MAKVSEEAKTRYFERIKEYKKTIEQIYLREKNLEKLASEDVNGAAAKRIIIADENMNLVSYFVLMNDLSLSLLGVKNENFLNEARKCCYKSIISLEEAVTPFVDVPFSDYEEKLAALEGLDDAKRYELIRKLGFAIQSVEDSFGENSKWKWSFVELEARFATVSKNLLNLKTLVAGLDPRVPGYEIRLAHMNLAKRLLQLSADRYREKYELSTHRIDDFKQAIGYLGALKRIHMLVGEQKDAELVKKKMEVWQAKMEKDDQSKEQKNKEERLKKA